MTDKTIVILGPTAVGKSKFAIELAKKIDGEIISADSMQVYRGMDIGTAKPTKEEMQGIPHYLIDVCEPDEKWTVADFVEQAQRSKVKVQNQGKIPIIVGGTGLYLWSLLNGYEFPSAPEDKSIRNRLSNIPLSTLYAQLSSIDPEATKKIHANNKKRIIRALEVYELTGKKFSDLQKKNVAATFLSREKSRDSSPSPNGGLKTSPTLIGLTLPRDELYSRINTRVDQMIEKGLIDEVKGLLAKGYAKDLPSMQALGYKEVIQYLEGTWDKDKMIEELKKRTRHFAKRQETWFKRFSAEGGSAYGGENVEWQSPQKA